MERAPYSVAVKLRSFSTGNILRCSELWAAYPVFRKRNVKFNYIDNNNDT